MELESRGRANGGESDERCAGHARTEPAAQLERRLRGQQRAPLAASRLFLR